MIFQDLLTLTLFLVAADALALRAFQFAVQHKNSVYDSLYRVLATDRKRDFVTVAQTLVNKFRGMLLFERHLSTIKP